MSPDRPSAHIKVWALGSNHRYEDVGTLIRLADHDFTSLRLGPEVELRDPCQAIAVHKDGNPKP